MSILPILLACGEPDPTVSDPFTPPAEEPEDTLLVDSAGEAPADPRADFACFADVTVDDGDDGVVDGIWFDGMSDEDPTWLMFREGDDNGNGILEFTETYVRNASGDVTRFVRDGTEAYSYDITYDDRGNPLTYVVDYFADGVADLIVGYAWDANDELVRYEEDSDGDGDLDYWYTFDRDAEGNRTAADESVDGDETVDFTYTYTRDAAGREYLLEQRDAAGALTLVRTYTYTDPVLHTGSYVEDLLGDGTTDGVGEVASDAEDRRIYSADDVEPYDGVYEVVQSWTWDDEDRVTAYELYSENGGDPFTYLATEAFDPLGRTVDDLYDYLFADGYRFAERTTWTYAGTCP